MPNHHKHRQCQKREPLQKRVLRFFGIFTTLRAMPKAQLYNVHVQVGWQLSGFLLSRQTPVQVLASRFPGCAVTGDCQKVHNSRHFAVEDAVVPVKSTMYNHVVTNREELCTCEAFFCMHRYKMLSGAKCVMHGL